MRTLISALSLHKPASRLLGAAALILLASGVLHLAVNLAVSGHWTGPISLRKPITFAFSVGMLLWTVGWVIDRMPSRPRLEKILGRTLAVSSLVEVGLITVQAWRGVPSHFNLSTPEDGIIFGLMGVSVIFMSLTLVATTVCAFRQPPVEPGLRLAVRAGMLLIVAGLGVGQWMIELGNDFFEQFDRVPDRVLAGAAGAPTFPHAMGFHGIQVFILAALLAGLLGLEVRAAQRVVRLVVAGYSVLLVWSIVQAASGGAPLDLFRPALVLALIGIGLLVAPAGLLVVGGRRSTAPEIPDAQQQTPVPSAR